MSFTPILSKTASITSRGRLERTEEGISFSNMSAISSTLPGRAVRVLQEEGKEGGVGGREDGAFTTKQGGREGGMEGREDVPALCLSFKFLDGQLVEYLGDAMRLLWGLLS